MTRSHQRRPAACMCAGVGMLLAAAGHLRGQTASVSLTTDRWTATDSVGFVRHLGRPSIWIDKGVALARDIELRNGTIELDTAATEGTNFKGVAFHARSLDNSEVIFLRLGPSGTPEAVQYAPALNGVGAAWQIYHGPGANAIATLPRARWVHLRIEIAGNTASLFLDRAKTSRSGIG
jgi:hypothetical protein